MSYHNQPICDDCWDEHNAGQEAQRMREKWRQVERCAYCAELTESGIYKRMADDDVPYPVKEEA